MVKFKDIVLIVALTLAIAGCSSIGKYLPSEFDNVEYGKLVELNTIAIMPAKSWCNPSSLNQMNYRAQYLHTYAEHRLNPNIAEIYAGIHGLTTELAEREKPSETYCKIKRTNIHDITTTVLETFGDRK